MTISVITVVRNDVAGIKKTLQTVASQADCSVQVEHVIIDGASTDSTATVINGFVAARSGLGNPKYTVVHESDTGIYDAMSKGRALASGDFAYFLNAGDTFSSRLVLAGVADCIERVKNPDAFYYGQVHCRAV
jgi:glycosyltransferase involved in cell wall biosynthesis